MIRPSVPYQVFQVCNYALLACISLLCVLPLLHILALSLSSAGAASSGKVLFWPLEFSLTSYQVILGKPEFLRSLGITLQRIGLGLPINLALVVLTAYPLSKERERFRLRTVYAWIFVFTMLFGGGLIPTYMTVKETGLLGTIWALVIPSALGVFNVVLLLNFFRGLPKELEEASFMDGAGHWTTLFRIFIPLSMPAIATITLLTIVGHWNAWFDGMIYMMNPEQYPLSTYLQKMIVFPDFKNLRTEDILLMTQISERTVRAAQIFLGSIPILLIYPYLQKHFVKGIVLGSVKE